MANRKSIAERFWKKVERRGPDECWPWTGARLAKGYGVIGIGGRRQSNAHRVAWEMFHGPIPDGLWVLHRCDNPPCVNPAHLFLGTRLDNERDKVRKGRTPSGDRNGSRRHPERLERGEGRYNAKLTNAAVLDIRASNERLAVIAKRYGISIATAWKVRHRLAWAHVKPHVPSAAVAGSRSR